MNSASQGLVLVLEVGGCSNIPLRPDLSSPLLSGLLGQHPDGVRDAMKGNTGERENRYRLLFPTWMYRDVRREKSEDAKR